MGRPLPTALIHFLISECFAIWIALASWISLIGTIQVNTALDDPTTGFTSELHRYFTYLYFFGNSFGGVSVNYTNVVSEFFLLNKTIGFNKTGDTDSDTTGITWTADPPDTTNAGLTTCTLTLPRTYIDLYNDPANGLWVAISWYFSLMSLMFIAYIFKSLFESGVWSFDEVRYLAFTSKLYRSTLYKIGAVMMALGPIALALLWIGQFIHYGLWDQTQGLTKSLGHIFALVMATKTIALPSIKGHNFSIDETAEPGHPTPGAQRAIEDWHNLKIKRPLMQLNPTAACGGNAAFGLALINALWLYNKVGDDSELKPICPDGKSPKDVAEIFAAYEEKLRQSTTNRNQSQSAEMARSFNIMDNQS